jgi:2-polyprenyl-3-methyl-5-hydroxy-6-metoxy-1,4-benzoquinol methylase
MANSNTAATAGFQNLEAYEKLMGRWSRRLAPLLVRFGGLSGGDRVIDVGCGTGSLTFTVREIANVSSVASVDLTEAYLEFARAHIPARGSASGKPTPEPCRSKIIRSIALFRCSYSNLFRTRPTQ